MNARGSFKHFQRGTILRAPFAVLLVLMALFSLSVLSSWHELHPDLPEAAHVHGVDHASDHDATPGAPDLDHVAGHASLHGASIAAPAMIVLAVPTLVHSWHATRTTLMASIVASTDLRPPQG